MKIETIISFKGMEPSPAVEADIRQRVEHLEKFHDRIVACRVVVNAPHKHGHKGKLYHVHIDLSVPGGSIFVNREAGFDHAHEDIYVALRDAFDAAQRQLEDYVRKHSGFRTKRHPITEHGEVTRIFSEDGYGFIETRDGREVFFSQDSVNNKVGWEIIDVGSKVRFSESEGDKGPYAISVTLVSSE